MIKLERDCKTNNPTNHPARSGTAARRDEAVVIVVRVHREDAVAVVAVAAVHVVRGVERGKDRKGLFWSVVDSFDNDVDDDDDNDCESSVKIDSRSDASDEAFHSSSSSSSPSPLLLLLSSS